MKVLLVFAHPEPLSLNGALRDSAIRELKAQGHVAIPPEGLDQGGRRQFRVDKRQAQQRRALTCDGRLNGAALVVEGDACLGIEIVEAGSLFPRLPAGHGCLCSRGPHSKVDQSEAPKLLGIAQSQVGAAHGSKIVAR